jgi:hypothetical protein
MNTAQENTVVGITINMTERLSVRFTEVEADELRRAALALNCSLSHLVRLVIWTRTDELRDFTEWVHESNPTKEARDEVFSTFLNQGRGEDTRECIERLDPGYQSKYEAHRAAHPVSEEQLLELLMGL